ncbi:MAG TPA: hypothetical protein VIZ28_03430 [Chitinophagaceae bacterium]
MKKIVTRYPLFLLLLPVFFVLHGFMENYDFVPVKDAALLILLYYLTSLILLLLFRFFYKNWLKAALMTFITMAFHFFFGSIQDAIRNYFPGSLISKYAFLLPASFCLLLLLFIFLKKTKKPLQKTASYLNLLFLLLIVIDIVLLARKMSHPKINEAAVLSKEFTPFADSSKPDVYIIISDEYAGNTELKDIFNFDNTPFFDQLVQRGFHVIPKSTSNYNFTHYSIASTLNMDYLDLRPKGNQPLLAYAYETVRNNKLLHFLQHHQYKFYNYSLVDFKGDPAHTQETFLPVKTRLITSQTFLSRLNKEVRYHLVTWLKSKKEIRKNVYDTKINNETLIPLTLKAAEEKTIQPKFVLTHLLMPHYPYYFDKNGKEFPLEQLMEGNQHLQQNYIEYLQYTNKKLLEITDHILENSSTPPVIILMGDHGFRHFDKPVDPKYFFYNLAAVHLPGKNYSSFTDSLTNVNLVRAVLNTTFNQQLHYLKDTTIITDNP